jgi:N-acetylglucosaminyldiphosphoundecaprenol N-acetyl-beta-D-mannosaminyltransferase
MSNILTNLPTRKFVPTQQILNVPIAALTFAEQMQVILDWASSRQSKMVCVANVHMLMEAHWRPKFARVLADADLRTPDGMPLVWMMKLLGVGKAERVAGMDIFQSLCQKAQKNDLSVFFVGSEPEILDEMRDRLHREFPNLHIAGMVPLPFEPLPIAVDRDLVQAIENSGARLVFVSLGCPKQEYWMHQHKGKIKAVTIGLGGVFPIYAGLQSRAPGWMRWAGLEWAYRLLQEPKRLWWRYFRTIPPFLWLAFCQLTGLSQKTDSKVSCF